ncbi:MAG: DUF72 domain-containing protein [Gemmatimonadaceae bacterium]|nr:DUF72 domain-containing protein [Gemmatimonadaceae bacterium]NUO95949.1 DUF72 domain-containing protein [Gemmatimonadaceae bacterium]NUP57349.1 DUF72 domain-containing protein [Gemmatimonadaceae bacterium]NUP70626.1 DUF72 domain-containing protein [Gemmatimonadaceae bacterium]
MPARDGTRPSRAFIGISGYDYQPWRGRFYPEDLPRRRWLEYASRSFNSVELNGTFYSLKSPPVFARWVSEVASKDFVFAVKGGRFITHNLKLRNAEASLGNFFASGVLALGRMTGPFLWQLPATYRFDAERMDSFMRLLPRTSREAEQVALQHDDRLRRGALVDAAARVTLRHAFEVRHESYFHDEFYALLREHRCAFVVADTAGKFPYAEEVTADFVYVRLHGSRELYASGYTDEELDEWARKIARWRARQLDVYVYFDNDAKVHAPFDAKRLAERVP